MFVVYKYTLFKYLKSHSTWVIILLGVLLCGVLGGYLPFNILEDSKDKLQSFSLNYAHVITLQVSLITSMFGIFISIFCGFKSASMYKDEVEDGTFLIILSKPCTRKNIILGKWLSLQTIILIFTFLSTSSFVIFVLIFDASNEFVKTNNLDISLLRNSIFKVGFIMWVIFIFLSLIFSSIALLLSTKISVGATIGASIALGVLIPITSIIGTFTQKNPYEYVSSFNELDKFANRLKNVKVYIERNLAAQNKDKLNVWKIVVGQVDRYIIKTNRILDKIYNKNNDANNLHNLGIRTGKRDKFSTLWPFDLNFHIKLLSTFAIDNIGSLKNGVFTTRTISSEDKLSKQVVSQKTNEGAPVSGQTKFLIKSLQNFIPDIVKLGESGVSILSRIMWPSNERIQIQDNRSPSTPIGNDSIFFNASPIIKTNLQLLFFHFRSMQFAPISYVFNRWNILNYFNYLSNNNKLSLVDNQYLAEAFEVDEIKDIRWKYKDPIDEEESFSRITLNEKTLLKKFIALVNYDDGSYIVKIEKVDYVSRTSILFFYLGLAIFLVPLSFIIVRKQDFV